MREFRGNYQSAEASIYVLKDWRSNTRKCPVTSDIIKGFNRDTVWLATGVLGPIIFAALVFAVQEYHPTNVYPPGESVQAGSDRSLNANVVVVASMVAKSSNDKIASGEGSGVDHAYNKASPKDDPTSLMKPIAAPIPAFAFTL